jgi:hypothetical protein
MLRFSFESGIERRIDCKLSKDKFSVIIIISALKLTVEVWLPIKEAMMFNKKLTKVLNKVAQ